jgi:hypothetical protein
MTLAYTPELSDYHSGTLRRIAWALGKPMTKTLHAILDSMDLVIEPDKVCERCRDRSRCDQCYFKTRARIDEGISIDSLRSARPAEVSVTGGQDPIKIPDQSACNLPTDPAGQACAQAGTPELSTEVDMKVNQVSVLVSKKIGKNFCSWSLSYGATAEVEEEHFAEAISQLDTQLREMVSTSLPTPNGDGNGNGSAH